MQSQIQIHYFRTRFILSLNRKSPIKPRGIIYFKNVCWGGGGLISMGDLFEGLSNLAKMEVSVLYKELFIYLFIYNNFICNNQYKKAAIREELNPHVRWPPKNIYKAIKEI